MRTLPDSYAQIASLYDVIMGDRVDIPYVEELIRRSHPDAATLLELACGSGTALMSLSRYYDVVGIDISLPMLELAEQSMLHAEFHQADMTSFKLERRFDVIICIFDSINHLSNFSDWKKTFRRAKAHLNEGGVFIFDINSETKLRNYCEDSPIVDNVDQDVCIFNVSPISRGRFLLDIRYFEHFSGDQFTLYHAEIIERTYPAQQVRSALKEVFQEVKVYDENLSRPSNETETLYFICRP